MYGKKYGHTDWVTTVAHLADGNVLSGAMDGKISTNSFDRVGNISLNSSTASAPPSVLVGHTQPVLECAFRDNTLVSGDKSGSLVVWDINRAQALHRFRAHPGAITAVDVLSDGNTFVSCGTDGYVKIWDPRSAGSGLVCKIPAHVRTHAPPTPATVARTAGRGTTGRGAAPRVMGGTVSGGGFAAESTTGRPGAAVVSRSAVGGRGPVRAAAPSGPAATPITTASAISCMSVMSSRGSGDVSYIVTGSGGGGGSGSVVLLDARASFGIVSEWNHHRNGVYSLCTVGDECVFSGDGAGNLLCHSLLDAPLDQPNDCLRYGLGASSTGAVRAICCLSGKVVAAGEDGNVVVFDYTQAENLTRVYK
eukprot:gene31274-38641_t